MEDKKKNIRHVLNIIVILFITMLLVSGGTFAYLRWISSEDQQTNLAIQIEENINMHIENPLLTKAGMYPTNTCTNEAATMSGVSIIALENQTGVIARPKFKLRVKITDKSGNVITNTSAGTDNGNNPYRYFINYAVAEENGTCTEPLYTGNFDQNEPTYQGQTQWYDSEWITLMNETTGFPLISNGQDSGVSFNGTPYQTTYHNYKVWVWIDESYTSVNTGDVVSDKLQDAKIELSWSENSTVQQIKAQAYAVFSSSEEGGDDSLRFYQSDEPITEDSTYAGRPVTNVYTGFEVSNYSTPMETPWYADLWDQKSATIPIEIVVVEDTISPISTAYWFSNFRNCSYIDVTKLNTSNVTNMSQMFAGSGYYVTDEFTIIGMENWDTSKVTNMASMFSVAGYNVTTFNISNISRWDVSNVTKMSYMFGSTGQNTSNNWSLDLSGWDVYKVTDYSMFEDSDKIIPPNWYTSYAVYSDQDNSLRFYRTQTDLTNETTWNGLTIRDLYYSESDGTFNPGWADVKDLTERVIFEDVIIPTTINDWFSSFINVDSMDLRKLDVSNITDMSYMFSFVDIENIDITGWNTSKVTDMSNMFIGSYIGSMDYNQLNTSNVTNMDSMFYQAFNNNTIDLNKWDVSNVTNMFSMFAESKFTAIKIDKWNTSNVTNMRGMLADCNLTQTLDLRSWDVSNVTDHTYFDSESSGIIPPNFN